jgi:hypothetical protein
VLESLSFWTGLRALLLISLACYVLSAVFLRARERAPSEPVRAH